MSESNAELSPIYWISLDEAESASGVMVSFQVEDLTDRPESVSIAVLILHQDQQGRGYDELVHQARQVLSARLTALSDLLTTQVSRSHS